MSDLTQETASIPPWTLGWRLRRSLEHAGIDVQEMADTLEVHRSTLSRWFHDEVQPKTLFLREWAVRTGVSYDWLAGGTTGTETLASPGPTKIGPAAQKTTPKGRRTVKTAPARRPNGRGNHSYRYSMCVA